MLRTTARTLAVSAIAVAVVAGGVALAAYASPEGESEQVARTASASAAPRPTPTASVDPVPVTAPLAPAVLAQIDYVTAYWQHYNSEQYGVIPGNDCVNFASQSLVARGWTQDDDWYHDDTDVASSSASWRSSTAMRDWLGSRPDLATPLDDTQRDLVAVGDIVQFDWDGSGDRDHTGIVTRIARTSAGVEIFFAGHSEDSIERSVDEAITVDHPGGSAFYWHLAG